MAADLVCGGRTQIDALRDPVLAAEAKQSKQRIEETFTVLQRLIKDNHAPDAGTAAGSDPLFANGAFTKELWYWAWLSVQVRYIHDCVWNRGCLLYTSPSPRDRG